MLPPGYAQKAPVLPSDTRYAPRVASVCVGKVTNGDQFCKRDPLKLISPVTDILLLEIIVVVPQKFLHHTITWY